jgi:DNA-binding CsgD family transcriptional regulator
LVFVFTTRQTACPERIYFLPMPFGGKHWTIEEERELARLRAAGISLARMAIRLRRSQRAVEVRLHMIAAREPNRQVERQAQLQNGRPY